MANIRGKSSKGVDLVVVAYDSSVSRDKESGEVKTQWLGAYLHPDTQLAQGPDQTSLALNRKRDEKAASGFNYSHAYSAEQFEQIKAAAGENKQPILKDGQQIGEIYGVRADLMAASDKSGLVMKVASLQPSQMTVGPIAGRDVMSRVFETQTANRAQRDAQQKAQPATAQTQPALAAEASVEAAAELGG